MMVEPRDAFERCPLDGFASLPTSSVDHLGLVEPVDGLGLPFGVAGAGVCDPLAEWQYKACSSASSTKSVRIE